jgi:hypothetical protein
VSITVRNFSFLHHRLSVPFATIYFNPMNNCSNKYEIHLYSFSSSSLSPSSTKFNLVACDLDGEVILSDDRNEAGNRAGNVRGEGEIIKCNNRWMQFSTKFCSFALF